MAYINEKSKLNLAIDITEGKVADILREKRECKDINEINKLDLEFKNLICKRELVYNGNKNIIDSVIKEAEEK